MSEKGDETSQKLAFADSLLTSLQSQAFTGLNKSELELMIFKAFVQSGLVDLKETDFAIAVQLRVSTRKITSLRYSYRVQTAMKGSSPKELLDSIVLMSVDESANRVSVSIDDNFFREHIVSELKYLGVAGDGSFNRAVLVVDADKFLQVLKKLSGKDGESLQKQVNSAIRRRKASNFSSGLAIFLREIAAETSVSLLSQFLK
jgi:hypothetical protein